MRVGHYELGAVLGDGGMGTVYAAVDTRFARKVAIKLLHPHLARNPEVLRRFRTEAVIGAKLSHPHVVRVYDVLEAEGVVGFVMEHVDGRSLDRVLEDRPGGLEVEEALKLFRQVVAGVAHAHAAGLVHRDIKPSNVLVEVVDGASHAKVTDFGVAKVVGGETRLTGTGAKIGTLAYMSPEQIEDPASVDARSDVYSLGVLAYEMLTGDVPFEAGTEFEVMRRILAGARRPNDMQGGKVPVAFSPLLRRCLSTRAGDRFVDARELLGSLASAATARSDPRLGSDMTVSPARSDAPAPTSATSVVAPKGRLSANLMRWAALAAIGAGLAGLVAVVRSTSPGGGGAVPLAAAFVLDSVTGPVSLSPGDEVVVTVAGRLVPGEALPKDWTQEVHLTSAEGCARPALAPSTLLDRRTIESAGETVKVTTTSVRVPGTFPPGTYHWCALIVPRGGQQASTGLGNPALLARDRPDLVAERIECKNGKSHAIQGETVLVDVAFSNKGNVTVGGGWRWEVRLTANLMCTTSEQDPVALAWTEKASAPPRSTRSETYYATIPATIAPGTYYWCLVVDAPPETVLEDEKRNNWLVGPGWITIDSSR